MQVASGSLASLGTGEDDVQEDDQQVGAKDGSEVGPGMRRFGKKGRFGC